MPSPVSQRRKLRILTTAVGLVVAAQACYFAACVTVNWPDDDRSDAETRKLQSRVNRHSEVSAIFQKHGQSGLVVHRDTKRPRAKSKDKEKQKKTLVENQSSNPKPSPVHVHQLVIPHVAQFTPAELDQVAAIVAQESKDMAFSESVEFENVETDQITRIVGAKGAFVSDF